MSDVFSHDTRLDRYRFDLGLTEDTYKKFGSGRHNVISTQISGAEVSILQSAYNESNFARTRADETKEFEDAMSRMSEAAEQAYTKNNIGSWSLGAIMTFAGLGRAILREVDEPARLPALLRWKSQVLSAQMLANKMTLWSVVAVSARWLIDFDLGRLIPSFLQSQGEVHGALIEDVQNAQTMMEWFLRIQRLLPVTDSIFGVYWCLTKMVQQNQIDPARLNAIPGLGIDLRQAEENRWDELAAYTGSHAIGYYLDAREHACADYIAGLLALAKERGKGVAKRQTKYDVARLWIPKFLAEEACRAVDEGQLPAWAVASGARELGQISGAIFSAHATFRPEVDPVDSIDSEEEAFISTLGFDVVSQIGEHLRISAQCRGGFTSSGPEGPRIFVSPTLSPRATGAAVSRQFIHSLKNDGVLRQDVPISSAIEYLMEFGAGPDGDEQADTPDELLLAIGMARGHYRQRPAQTLEMLSRILESYRKDPKEDAMSFFWGAVLTGVTLELFGESRKTGLRYLIQLASGEAHARAVQIAKDPSLFGE